ncbi:DUF4105 domain-containing protein, partial [Oleiphilus sp. HI0128]
LACLSFNSLAQTIPDSKLTSLADNEQWLDLLHFHQIGFIPRFESQVDDDSFFIAPDGKYSPKSELKANIAAFTGDSSNLELICQFPARFHWLTQQLPELNFPEAKCPDYEDWFAKIDPKSLTLSFPAAYLNSPSSMFGHTFIRIDRASGSNALLDYSINFAANANPDDNELVFTYKGLSGGYPGVFTILPYYEKVKEYSHLESRDVWEYALDLTQEEVEQFVRHTWEIRTVHFDYYFVDENCSYQLLTLLDAASERFNFVDAFKLSAIPSDTVRAIEQAGAVKHARFRPSTLSLMTQMIDNLSDDEIHLARNLVEDNKLATNHLQRLDTESQAKVLELAYQYSRYLAVRKKSDLPHLGKRTIELLSTRSKIDKTKVFPDFPTPKYRDDQGHNSRRLTLAGGYDGSHHFQQLEIRAAYHDQLDALPGYIQGAKLEMLNMKVRRTEVNNEAKTRLQELKLIDIASYTPRNLLITPISWHVATGFYRPRSAPEELSSFLNAGGGLSYEYLGQRLYILTDGELNLDNDIDKGYWLAAGPRLGWLSQHEDWNLKLEAYRPFDLFGAKFKRLDIELGFSFNLGAQWQIRAQTAYHSFYQQQTKEQAYQHSSSFSLVHYF